MIDFKVWITYAYKLANDRGVYTPPYLVDIGPTSKNIDGPQTLLVPKSLVE